MSIETGAISSMTKRRLESYVAEWMADNEVPGASVAVVDGTELHYAEGFGARNLAENLPATPDTLYGIGSCTKSFVATAVLQRTAAGDLTLSDPVNDYLPHLTDVPGDSITIEDLLTHTSGMPSDGNLSVLVTRLTDIGDANVPLSSADDFRRHVQSSTDERYTDEERFFYYNTGYSLLGKIVEAVTDTSFHEYVREHILDPLSMERSCFEADRFMADDDRMTAYFEAEDGWKEGKIGFAEPISAPGGMVSSVVEMSRYLRALMNGGSFDGARLLDPAAVQEMSTPRVTRDESIDGETREYGYGLLIQPSLDDTLVGHGGLMGTTTAFVGWLKDANMGVVVACNTAPKQHPRIAGHALLSVLHEQDPYEAIPQLALERTNDSLVGEYESYKRVQTATVDRDGTTLTVSVGGRLGDQSFTLFPERSDTDDLTYYTVSGDKRITVEFVETDAGVDMLFKRWRLHRRHD